MASCEECRSEGFYFAEIGTLATKLDAQSVRPDFNLRLRAAIRRAEDEAARPLKWTDRVGAIVFRPMLVAASVVVLGVGALGAWGIYKGADAQKPITKEIALPEVNPQYGLKVGYGQSTQDANSGLVPVDGLHPDARRLRERYLQAEQLPHDYVMDGIPLDRSALDSAAPRFVLPTVTPDQVTRKVSY